jgi:alkanesulfonate monooxygenase SsuD/methylene tetrahydromethanopterin reductase-like flavin-dependent oxidoreductase (luciferase family)
MALTKVTFGVFLPFYAFKNQSESAVLHRELVSTVQECERLGFHSVWLDDHLMYGTMPILECWTTLAALASITSRIRLGTMVTSNAFRNPALLAKMAANVDVISNGRLEFGLGAGIQPQEHLAYGYPFPNPAVRIEKLKESVEIIKLLWTKKQGSYSNQYYHIEEAVCEPKPLQKPHPPITIGGTGEKLLRVTAEHANRFDFSYQPTIKDYKDKLNLLEKTCKSVGRAFEEIEKSCWPEGQIILGSDQEELEEKIGQLKPKGESRKNFERTHFLGTPDMLTARIQPYLGLGVTHFMLFFSDLPELRSLKLFAEKILPMKL